MLDSTEKSWEQINFCVCLEKYFETCKTPIGDLSRALLDIKPPPHVVGLALLSFSKLYEKFRNTRAKCMVSAFFTAQLFREITDSDDLNSEHLVTNIVEELLFNCSTRELKTNPREQNIQFHDAEYFTRALIRILSQEQLSNHGQENDENSRNRKNIRGVFEKDQRVGNSLIEPVKNIRKYQSS